MKISFSTIACPDFSWKEIYSMAKDLGFHGIEVRGLGDDIFAVKAKPFTDGELPATIEKLKKLNLEIPCLSSGCCLKDASKKAETLEEIRSYIGLAKKLSTPFIRVLADLKPEPEGEVDDEAVAATLKEAAKDAEAAGVTLIVETNGVYSDTKRLRKLLDSVGSSNVGALWDMHHPYRYMGEAPQETVENLGSLIKYIHVKDSVIENG